MLYDKTGAAFRLDHEIDGVSYVRPMVKVVTQSTTYSGDDFHEEEGFEPADFLVARNTSELFDAPPVALIDSEIKAKREGLQAFIADAKRQEREAQEAKRKAEHELFQAKRDLERWLAEHKVMSDLGKLLDGATLYPLTVKDSPYHGSPDIPYIPKMSNASYVRLSGGNWQTGKSWSCKNYASDGYGNDFRFYDTKHERADAIKAAFDRACEDFRKAPNFSDEGRTYSTRLDFGRLSKWVETHPALSIPEDIAAAKAENDAALAKAKREKLAAELAAMDAKQ